MHTRRRVASGLLAASLLLPVPFTALPMFAQGAPVARQSRQGAQFRAQQVPAPPSEVRRSQARQRRQLNQIFRSIRTLLRNQHRLQRQLGVVSNFRLPVDIFLPL
jgi:TolA-binding protein